MFFLIKQLPPKSTPKVLRVAYTTRFRSPQSSAQKSSAQKASAPKAPVPKAPAPKASAPKAPAPKASATKPQAVKAPAAKAQPVRPEPAAAQAPQNRERVVEVKSVSERVVLGGVRLIQNKKPNATHTNRINNN